MLSFPLAFLRLLFPVLLSLGNSTVALLGTEAWSWSCVGGPEAWPWTGTIARDACCSGRIAQLRLGSHLVDGLLRDNHVVDTCSRLSSSRLSGVGCMRFALMTKVISTLRVWRAWSSGRLRACNLDVFFFHFIRHNEGLVAILRFDRRDYWWRK